MSSPLPGPPPADDPGWLLKEIAASSHELGARLARDVGLGWTDFRALDVLMQDGPAGPNELGRRLGLTSPAATALADRLERAGHVERVRDPDDRRRVSLVPTDHAREEAWRVLRAYVEDMRGLVDALAPAEREVVSRFLTRALELQRRHAAT